MGALASAASLSSLLTVHPNDTTDGESHFQIVLISTLMQAQTNARQSPKNRENPEKIVKIAKKGQGQKQDR